MRISKANIAGLAIAVLSFVAAVVPQNRSGEPIPPMPKLLTQREQMKVRSDWLRQRLDTLLLPMMKRNGIDVWIVVNEEFHSDPVTEYIVPPIPVVGRFGRSRRPGSMPRSLRCRNRYHPLRRRLPVRRRR